MADTADSKSAAGNGMWVRLPPRALRVAFLFLFLLVACHGTEPSARSFLMLSAGFGHTCALDPGGRAWCWGSNASGRLGNGDTVDAATPVPVAGSLVFRTIAAGFSHTCAVRDNGAVFCWGENGNGELGDGTTEDRHYPVPVAGGPTMFAVSTGEGMSCGLAVSDSGLYCWGTDIGGVNALPRDHLRPTRYTPGRFTAVSVGYEIACALRTGGQAACWGYGGEGQLGDGSFTSSDIPVEVDQSATGPFRALQSGHDHTCALALGGAVWCWGSNEFGQLGAVSPLFQGVPLAAAVGAGADSIAAHSAGHTCLLRDTEALCWGGNGSGQLGDGSTNGGVSARPVAGGAPFRQLSLGASHSCGLDAGGAAWCWGRNNAGQLGTGGASASLVPTRVVMP